MNKQKKLAVAILVSVSLIAIGLCFLSWVARHWAADVHQRSVTRELAKWEEEDSHIATWQDAMHAVDVVRYVEHYYVPGEGYRSNPATERALAAQRQRTIEAIVRGLEAYSGEKFGTDLDRWEKWRDDKKNNHQ